MRQIFLITLAFPISIFLLSSNAFADSISINKQNYDFGDVIIISGKTTYSEGKFIGLQILNPSKSDIVLIDQFFPQKDGAFTKPYKAQGPKWHENGIYTVKLVYDDQIFEKTFDFKNREISKNETTNPDSTENKDLLSDGLALESDPTNPKYRVLGFPNPVNSPQYYFDRYNTEKEYKEWFDTTFPDYSISEVVGYPQSRIEGFPDENYPPWYYIDRYFGEDIYKNWFDFQFPTKSIYVVLGYPESFFQKVPDWVKNNAKWWSSDLITDSDFLSGITFLINERILIVPNLPESGSINSQTIPVWVKNTAGWWAEGKIDENEFLKGIQFLVENGIIQV